VGAVSPSLLLDLQLQELVVCRERAFYAERGLPCPKDMEAETEKDEKMKKVRSCFYQCCGSGS